MKNEVIKTLKKFGLSENEVKVYTEALKLDETSPYELSQKTGIPRTTVYDVITNLSLKGLLKLEQSDGFTKQQTKITAKNPSELRKQVRAKHDELHKLEVELVNVLPDLKKLFSKTESNSDFEYFPGIEGARKVYSMENELLDLVPMKVIDQLTPMDALGKDYINKDVDIGTRKHLDLKKSVKELVPLNDWTKHILSYQFERDEDYIKAREIRFIENPIFQQYQRLVIAGERVMIICTEEDEAWGISIKSKFLTKSFESIFDLLWTQSNEVTAELIRSWGPNQFRKQELRSA